MASKDGQKPLHIYNELYGVLAEYFPDHRSAQKVFNVPGFASDLGKSHETIYKALRSDRLHIGVALEVLKLSAERHPEMPIYWGDLIRFVLPDFLKFSDPALLPDG